MTAELVPLAPAAPDAVPLPRVVVLEDDEDLARTARLRARLDEALAARPGCVVVDLARCARVDASALTVLLEAHRAARRQGGELVLRGVSARVERLLALTGVTGVFRLEVGQDEHGRTSGSPRGSTGLAGSG